MQQLDENNRTRISTGNWTKGEKIFEWQSIAVSCADNSHRKYQICLSDKQKIRGFTAYGTCKTGIEEFVKTAGIHCTIEMNFTEMKGETKLDQYEVRSYDSRHKYITLSCIAHAFLTVLGEQFQELLLCRLHMKV